MNNNLILFYISVCLKKQKQLLELLRKKKCFLKSWHTSKEKICAEVSF